MDKADVGIKFTTPALIIEKRLTHTFIFL